MTYLIVLSVLTVLMFVACLYDAEETVTGIRAGVAVEGNPIIVLFFGNKPSLAQLLTYNTVETLIGSVMGVIGHLRGASLSFMVPLAIAWLASLTLKHYQGYRQWRWLIANPGKTIAQMEGSAFSKLIGFWG